MGFSPVPTQALRVLSNYRLAFWEVGDNGTEVLCAKHDKQARFRHMRAVRCDTAIHARFTAINVHFGE
jgi:hypothetical protein